MGKVTARKFGAILASASIAVASAAVLPVGLAADECQGLAVVYNNYKIDVPLWPDPHGHEGGSGDPGGDWQYVHTHYSDEVGGEYTHHSSFVDWGYADEFHGICVPN